MASKNLKVSGFLLLLLGALSLFELAVGIYFGDYSGMGISGTELDITQAFVLIVSFIFLIPQFYVGIKGIKVANNPDSSKLHIILAVILLIIAAGNIFSSVVNIMNQVNVEENVSAALSVLVELVVLIDYVVAAIAVSR